MAAAAWMASGAWPRGMSPLRKTPAKFLAAAWNGSVRAKIIHEPDHPLLRVAAESADRTFDTVCAERVKHAHHEHFRRPN
jgi:hypothetical protein